MSDQGQQLSLFCPTCAGGGVVVADARNHDGDLVQVPALCPVCRPSPALPETRQAVARLAQSLVAPSGQMTVTGTPRSRA